MSSPNFGVDYIVEGQNAGEVTFNDSVNAFDGVVQLAIQYVSNTPEPSPTNGQRFLVGAAGTGVWTGHNNKIALYYDGWIFKSPKAGWLCWDKDILRFIRHNGTQWDPLINNIPALTGSPTTADLKTAFNDLLTKMKSSGLMEPD